MKKLPKVKKQTWGTLIPTKWMVWACEPNEVFYLTLVKNKVSWVKTEDLYDSKDTIVFNKLDKAKEFIKKCIKKKLLPSDKINAIEYARVVPTFEDGKLWYEIYDEKEGKIRKSAFKEERV